MKLNEILMDSQLLKRKQGLVTQMYNERTKYETLWKKLSDYINPYRGRFYEEDGSLEGSRRDQCLINSYPMEVSRRCAAGLHSGLTSPSRPWFELSLKDEEKANYHPVRMWLNDVHDIMMSLHARGNSYEMLYNTEAEMCQFGTGAALLMQSYDTGMWCRYFTCGEYAGKLNNTGKAEMFCRKFFMDAYSMVNEFGKENVSQQVLNAYKSGDVTTKFAVEMLIERNYEYDPDKLALGNFPWRSLYYEPWSSDKFLRISGYYEQPFILAPWERIANTPYGIGCGHYSLGDCMQLQKIEENKLRATDNAVDPAMVYPSSMKDVDNMPGGVNFVPDGTVQQAYPLIDPRAKAYEGMVLLANETKQQIANSFYYDLMIMLAAQNTPQMTAREVAERHEEKLLMLGPVLEQFYKNVLEVTTLRLFGICHRNGILPPMPEEITKEELDVKFVSLLAQAQKMVSIPAIENVVGFAGNLAAIYPEAPDIIDVDKVIRTVAVVRGAPEKILRSEDEVAEIRKQRAQAQAQAMQAQEAAAAAQPVKQYAEAARLMSEVDTDKVERIL